ncbi:amidohydrolase family protein [Streptomyces sp. NPDC051572]|uniref:amidohydrolase family protein n=1 Tax=unclassified Streptomyces TaxID=2593676 RepID=UPI00344B03B4
MPAPQIVDMHAHLFPRNMPDLAGRTGDERWPKLVVDGPDAKVYRCGTPVRRAGRTLWDVAARIAALDEAGIDRQVVSPVPVTLVDWAEPGLTTAWTRAQNDLLAEAVAGSGGRLAGLGAVPLSRLAAAPDAAVAEAARVVGELGLAGIELPTLPAGRELDDPFLRPFWAAVEEQRVPVFVHPTDGAGAIRRPGQPYEFGIGMLTDTAMAATALVFGGVLDQYPGLRIALAHGCGSLPWAFPRIRLMAAANGTAPERADALLRTLWADALVFDPEHLRLVSTRFGAGHLMLGTDDPLVPGQLTAAPATVRRAVAGGALSAAEADGVLGANALAFLDRTP